MCRPRNFKPLLWLRCLFISSLAHENRGSFRPDYEQYRTRRDVFDSRVVVEIHEPRKISKYEHAARGVVLRSWSPVIVIGFLYDLGCAFRNLFGMQSSRLTVRPRASVVRCFPISTRTLVLSYCGAGHASRAVTQRSQRLTEAIAFARISVGATAMTYDPPAQTPRSPMRSSSTIRRVVR
jgi:hypothetical protein